MNESLAQKRLRGTLPPLLGLAIFAAGAAISAPGGAEPKPAWHIGAGCWNDSSPITALTNSGESGVISCGAKSNTEMVSGLISLEVLIDTSGKASSVKVQPSSTLRDAKVADCLTKLILAKHFPAPAGGSASVILPFRYGVAPSAPPAPAETRLFAAAGEPPIEVVTAIVSKQFGALNACYDAGKAKAPGLKGTLALTLSVDGAGTVTTADNGSTLSDATVIQCMMRAAQQLKFPSRVGVLDGRFGAELVLSVPFAPDKAAQPPKLPAPRGPELRVSGPLANCQVRNVLDQHAERFQACFASAQRKDPSVTGPAVVDFTINRSGSVSAAKANGPKDAPNKALSECSANAFKQLRFAATPQVVGQVTLSDVAAQGQYVVHFRPDY